MEPKSRLSARVTRDEVEALRPAVAGDPDRVSGGEIEGHLGLVRLAAGDQAAGGVALGDQLQLPTVSGGASEKRSCRATVSTG